MPFSFHYQTRGFRVKNKKQMADWLLTAAFLEQKEIEHIDFVFCDDAYLLELNKKFLHHRTLTDIITFDESTKQSLMAEIYISTERVRENAATYGVSFSEELRRVMIHGLLHCMGYGDKTEKEKRKMRRKEEEYLALFREAFSGA
jgi:rRNA maturation RNase YbeY